jgi:hypothetical protein
MAISVAGPGRSLEQPGKERREHGVEREDEDEVGGRGVVDGGDEGDRGSGVEESNDGAAPARDEWRRLVHQPPHDEPQYRCSRKRRSATRHEDRPWLAVRQPDKRDVDGERHAADGGQEQALGMVGRVGAGQGWLRQSFARAEI